MKIQNSVVRIIISGEGGQGVKLISSILSKILFSKGYELSLALDYDTVVRGGKIISFIVISKEGKVENPIIEEADYLFKLSEKGGDFPSRAIFTDPQDNYSDGSARTRDSDSKHKYKAKKTFTEEEETLKHQEFIPFSKIALENFESLKVMNMLVLGKLLKILEIDITKINLEHYLPEKFRDLNIKAIQFGFGL